MLISNTSTTHKQHIGNLIRSCSKRLVIVSPFLSSTPSDFLNQFDFTNVKTLELITTLKPNDKEQLTKPFQIREIFDFFRARHEKLNIKVHVSNSLHGKLYFSLNELTKEVVITSANFTNNGMENNHEWGVHLMEEGIVDQALQEVYESIEYEDVTRSQIEKCCQFVGAYKSRNPKWFEKEPEITGDSLKYNYADSDNANASPNYFIKPIGHTENRIELDDQEDFSRLNQQLHFSKKLPRGIRKGDVLITTAIGAGSMLSWFQVVSEEASHATEQQIKENTDLKRWPWYVEGRNKSPKFGGEWWEHNLQRNKLVEEFVKTHPNTPVTFVGGYTLNSLSYGSDKIKITKEFSEFVIERIRECEKTRIRV